MLKVILHPLNDQLRIDTEPVKTLEEALSLIREVFPHAAPAAAWVVWAGDKSQMWRLAHMNAWPNSTEMELDTNNSRIAALIENQSEWPPYRGALYFDESDRIVAESDFSGPEKER